MVSIIRDTPAERIVEGRTVITDFEVAELPYERQRELLVRRKYAKLVEQMDLVERLPEWEQFAKALQGSE